MEEELNQLWGKIKGQPDQVNFANLVKRLEQAVNSNELSIEDASYWICGTIRFDKLTDNLAMDDIIELACQLELPEIHRDIETPTTAQAWQELLKKTEGLG